MLSLEELKKEFEESFVSENIEYKIEPLLAVSFELYGERYCFPVEQVQEIVRLQHIIKVPKAPPFVLGVFNLRGEILSLNYLGEFLNHESLDSTEVDIGDMAIVLKSEIGRVGILASSSPRLVRYSVEDSVTNIESSEIEIINRQFKKEEVVYNLINIKYLLNRLLDIKGWESRG